MRMCVILPFALFGIKIFKSKVNTRMAIVLTSLLKTVARFQWVFVNILCKMKSSGQTLGFIANLLRLLLILLTSISKVHVIWQLPPLGGVGSGGGGHNAGNRDGGDGGGEGGECKEWSQTCDPALWRYVLLQNTLLGCVLLLTKQWTPQRMAWRCISHWAFQLALVVKNPPANAGDARDMGWIPGLGRFPWRRKW